MKVGIVSPQLGQQATKENVLQTAMIAENEGIDSLWVGERLLWPLNPQTPSPGSADGSLSVELQIVLDPLETLTYIAANTNKMILGTSVIELRKWNTNFRGKFLIHASKNVNKEKCKSLGIDYNKQNTGTIIGRAILYDVKKHDNKTELMGDKNRHYADENMFVSHMYGFLIKNAHRLKHPIQFSGKLGFFEVDDSVLHGSR